jgi:hypothetical protein
MKKNKILLLITLIATTCYSCHFSHTTKKFDEWCEFQHSDGKPVVEAFFQSTNFDSIRADFLICYKNALAQSYLANTGVNSDIVYENQIKLWLDKIDVSKTNRNLIISVPIGPELYDLHEQNLILHKKSDFASKQGYCIFSFLKSNFDTLFFMDSFGQNVKFDLKKYRDKNEQKVYDFLN